MKTAILVPCYNHGSTLPNLVKALESYALPIWIVNDGSNAETTAHINALASSHPLVTAIHRERNGGKGAAMKTGFEALYQAGFTHALQIDADGQHDATDIPKFLEYSALHPDALVSGRPIYDNSIPKGRLYGRYLTHVWVWIHTMSREIPDSMLGFRIYPLEATHRLSQKHDVGNHMDFDIDIMVRLAWMDVPMHFIPTKVHYPENGISHFRALKDNLLITKMHTRLFFESMTHWPRWIKRRFFKNSHTLNASCVAKSKEASTPHWSSIQERGFASGIELLYLIYRIGGRLLFSIALLPVIVGFWLTGRTQRQASRAFLKRICQTPGPYHGKSLYSLVHFYHFGVSILDKILSWKGILQLDKDVILANDYTRDWVNNPSSQGQVLFVSHFGVADAARALGQHKLAKPLYVLVFHKHAEDFKRMMTKLAPDFAHHLIAVDELGVDTALFLAQKMEEGAWIAIAADRTPINDEAGLRQCHASFLGELAPWPMGPCVLAYLLKAPVHALFCWRDGKHLWLEAQPIDVEPSLKRRDYIQQANEAWVKILERHTVAHPYQWFNFYDFWHKD